MIKSAPFDALLSLYGSPRAILILSCAFQREKMGKGRKGGKGMPLAVFSLSLLSSSFVQLIVQCLYK
jgi:hypothetical protein